jgi:hypothetical protein
VDLALDLEDGDNTALRKVMNFYRNTGHRIPDKSRYEIKRADMSELESLGAGHSSKP